MEAVNVALIGHSFIKRLHRFTKSCYLYDNLRLDKDNYALHYRYKGGLTVNKLAQDPDLCSFDSIIDIAFIQIGGNDACQESMSVENIVINILSYASFLHFGVGIKKIIIGQLLFREVFATFHDYNKKIAQINVLLADKIKNENLHFVLFWHHHGFWQDNNVLCFDGVHLNHFGMRKYFRSVRAAILHKVHKVQL